MCYFSVQLACNEARDGRTDIKHNTAETRSSMSLSMDRGGMPFLERLQSSLFSSFFLCAKVYNTIVSCGAEEHLFISDW